MATETVLEVMGSGHADGKGNATLMSFKRIEMHGDKIRKNRKKHKIPRVACKSDEDICALQTEMRWIKFEKAVECRFSKVDAETLASVLESKHKKQEETGSEEHRLYSVHLYLADDPGKHVRPTKTSMGIILKDVQIMDFELSGNLVIVEFASIPTPEIKNF